MDGKGRWVDDVCLERLWCSVRYEEVYLPIFGVHFSRAFRQPQENVARLRQIIKSLVTHGYIHATAKPAHSTGSIVGSSDHSRGEEAQ